MLWGWAGTNDIGHLWSLSIEEQFYLVWPVVLGALMLLRAKVWVTLALLVGSTAAVTLRWMHMRDEGYPEFLLWIRTEVRADGLLIGCLAGILFCYGVYPRRGLGAVATLSACVVAVCFWRLPSSTPYYQEWELVFSAAAAMVILASADGRWIGRHLLALRPVRAVGRVSYAVYLWHLPIILGVQRHTRFEDPRISMTLSAGLTTLATLISWYLVERPLLPLRRRMHPHPRAERQEAVSVAAGPQPELAR
jgi:peptidoglycan/LPS O-acetylase OafA/YrhL